MKNYTWSYNKENVPLPIKVEYILKYGDLDEIYDAIHEYGADNCKNIWISRIISDDRFRRLNYFLARFIFNISSEKSEIIEYFEANRTRRFIEVKPEVVRNKKF